MAPPRSSTPHASTPPLRANDVPPHLAHLADRFPIPRQKAGRHALIYNRAIRVPPPNPAVTRRTMSEPPMTMSELQAARYEIWTTHFHMPTAHSRPSSPSNDAPMMRPDRESHPSPSPLPAYPTPNSSLESLNSANARGSTETEEHMHHPGAGDGMELDDDVESEMEVKMEELDEVQLPDVNINSSPSRRSFASINALASESFEISVPTAPDALGLAQYDSLGADHDSQVTASASGPGTTHAGGNGNALGPLPSNASTISAWGSFGGHPPGFAAMLGNHIVTGPAIASSTATQTPSQGSSVATESIRAPSPTPHPAPAPAPVVFSALRPAPLRSAMKRKRAADSSDEAVEVEVKIETEAPNINTAGASSSTSPAAEGSRPKKVPRIEPQASSPPASEAASPPPEASSSSSGFSEAKPRRSDRLANRISMAGASSSAASTPKGKAKGEKPVSRKRTRRSS